MTGAAQGVSSADVARYYDSNTRRFLLVGGGGGVHAMHRELWGPGVSTAAQAAGHINRVIRAELTDLDALSSPRILDFGCGVGGTLFHLAEAFRRARLEGVTVSARQHEIAERLARRLGYADRCTFVVGDFEVESLSFDADAIVAVESFAHSSDAGAFLANAGRHLRPGGRLIVVDDFLAYEEHALDERQRLYVERLREGWRIPSLDTFGSLEEVAAEQGLQIVDVRDLTALTRPGSRLRDRALAVLGPVVARLGLSLIPFFGNMIGGHALQVGLSEGFIRYALVTFRKVA